MVKTQIGFIGAGLIAARHLRNLLTFTDVRVVALADPQVTRAQALALQCGGQPYADFNQMLEQERLDALYICVPPFAHGDPEMAALARQMPFFVEKPLAVASPLAETIAQQVAQQQLITAVGYHWRYLDITERAQTLLAQHPARLALGYWLDATPPPAWWFVESQSGGQLVEQATHIFDLARLLVGEVVQVYATGSRLARAHYPNSDICDVSAVTLNFASGAVGTIAATCLLNWRHQVGLHLFGEGLALELAETALMVDVGQGRPTQAAQGDPFVCEDRDFINAVQGQANRIRAPYAEALRTHQLATAAARSAREQQVVTVGGSTP